jgi:hypothetical protein
VYLAYEDDGFFADAACRALRLIVASAQERFVYICHFGGL